MKTVLVALPEAALAQAVGGVLLRHGYQSLIALSPEHGVRLAEQAKLALIVTDVQLPPIAGKDLCSWVRTQPHHATLPAIVYTTLAFALSTLSSLDTPVPRPVDLAAIPYQVESLIGKEDDSDRQEHLLNLGPLTIDLRTFDLHGPARSVTLTSTEFRLLQSLVKRRGAPVPPQALLSEHWGEYAIGGVALVRVHIRNLRAKIKEAAGRDPGLIRTARGLGYLLVSNDDSNGLST